MLRSPLSLWFSPSEFVFAFVFQATIRSSTPYFFDSVFLYFSFKTLNVVSWFFRHAFKISFYTKYCFKVRLHTQNWQTLQTLTILIIFLNTICHLEECHIYSYSNRDQIKVIIMSHAGGWMLATCKKNINEIFATCIKKSSHF